MKDLRVMPHLLLFEKKQERIPQLIFLLKLADIHCTVARTAEEVMNWVSACGLMLIQFDLFLLNSLEDSGLDNMLLTEICNVVTVPVVCVQREEVPPSIFSIHPVITCFPDEMLECLQHQLALCKKSSTKEKVE